MFVIMKLHYLSVNIDDDWKHDLVKQVMLFILFTYVLKIDIDICQKKA